MSFIGGPARTRVPATPSLPKGETVASYETYLEAQRAVDHLSDKEFPVQHVTIVGTDLRMVERVLGRLTYSRVALSGFASGAWFGLFVGWLLAIFSSTGFLSIVLAGVLIGGAFGLLFAVIAYAFTGGKRDFTSSSQIVASSYSVLCATEHAHKARELLREVGGVSSGWPAQPPAQPAAQPVPPAPAQPQYAPPAPSQYAPPAPQYGQPPQPQQPPTAAPQDPYRPQG